MKITAVYPGTFDPITNGHIDLARRAATLFDRVVVGVADDKKETHLLDAQTRVSLAQETLAGERNVEVLGFDGLLVDFAKRHDARVILRGLRAVSDFEYEFRLAGMNRQLDESLESVFLTPADEFTFISSSLIREIALLGGDISSFVPAAVVEAVQLRCEKLRKERKT